MKKLDEQQRKLVTKNHNLIYELEYRYHLEHETYYDLLAIGLCKAALSYNEDRENTFSTYACRVMLNEVYEWYRSTYQLKKRSGEKYVISYDNNIFKSDDESENLLKYLGTYSDKVYEEVAYDVMVSEMEKQFKKESHKRIVRLLCQGISQKAISDLFEISASMVYLINKKLREVYKCEYGLY